MSYSSSNNTGSVIGFGGVSIAGILNDDMCFPFNLNANCVTVTNGQFAGVGMAVTIDTGGPTQVKLCGTGDIIVGRLDSVEVRATEGTNVGTVQTSGGIVLPMDPTGGAVLPAVGDSVQGGVAIGTVVKLAPAQGRRNVVVSVDNTNMRCTVLFH